MTDAFVLRPWPHATWRASQQAATGYTWYWSDLAGTTGQQLTSQLPEWAPISTHVWGWKAGSWLRWRLDDDQVIGAELALTGPGEPVTVSTLTGQTWPDGGRVWFAHGARVITLHHVRAAGPLVFAALHQAGVNASRA